MGAMSKDNGRYPYTYACDYMRVYSGYSQQGINLSRGDASHIRQAIAAAIGMDDHELACKIADYYIENEEKVGQEADRAFKPYLEDLLR